MSISTSSTTHSNTRTIEYYINDKSYVDYYDVSHEVSGTITLGFSGSEPLGPKTGTNSVTLSGSKYISGVTCGSSHCGTYGLTATAEDATFET